MNSTEQKLEKMKHAYQVDSLAKLARRLDFTKHALYQWKRRDKMPVDKILIRNQEILKHFLVTGEGPVFKEKSQFQKEEEVSFQQQTQRIRQITEKLSRQSEKEPSIENIRSLFHLVQLLHDTCSFMLSNYVQAQQST